MIQVSSIHDINAGCMNSEGVKCPKWEGESDSWLSCKVEVSIEAEQNSWVVRMNTILMCIYKSCYSQYNTLFVFDSVSSRLQTFQSSFCLAFILSQALRKLKRTASWWKVPSSYAMLKFFKTFNSLVALET